MTSEVISQLSSMTGWLSFYSGVLTLVIIALCFIVYKMRNMLSQHDMFVDRFQEDLNAMCRGAVSVGDHLASLEEKSRSLIQRQDQLEMQEAPERSYKYAIKMAKNGANVEEVIEDCGLVRGEAELIFLANRMDKAS